jgi:hypothetical protein
VHHNHGLFSYYYLNEVITTQSGWFEMENEARKVRNLLRELITFSADETQEKGDWITSVLEVLGYKHSPPINTHPGGRGYRTLDNLPSELSLRIATNGQTWRLYERETYKHAGYYAVDMFDLLQRDAQDFMYFYAFFRYDAFTTNWLRSTLEESNHFVQYVRDKLQEQIYDAVELIAQGFLDYRRNELRLTPETTHTINEQSVVLLFRLLYVLYAESRNILPMVVSDTYRTRQSFEALKRQIVAGLELGGLDSDHSAYYTALQDLFFALDQGNPRFSLFPYQGKLFSNAEYPFLAKHIVGDAYLARAIEKLVRIPLNDGPFHTGSKLIFVDYRDLKVQYLNSIYRGQVYLQRGCFEVSGPAVRTSMERTLAPVLAEITEQLVTEDD